MAVARADAPLRAGEDADDAIGFQVALGSGGEVCREAGAPANDRREAIMAGLRAALAPCASAEGAFMPSGCLVITARNPA